MRRSTALLVALMTLGGSLVLAAPARASEAPPWPINCADDGPTGPGTQSVYVDAEGRLILNPEAAPDDAIAYALWAPDKALAVYQCIIAPVPLDSVDCMLGKLLEIANSVDPLSTQFRYVYPNPNGPGVAVDIQLLLTDSRYLVNCNISG